MVLRSFCQYCGKEDGSRFFVLLLLFWPREYYWASKAQREELFYRKQKNHPFLPTQAVCKEQKKENTRDLNQTPFMFNFHLKRLRHISMWQLTLRDVKLLAVIKPEWLWNSKITETMKFLKRNLAELVHGMERKSNMEIHFWMCIF